MAVIQAAQALIRQDIDLYTLFNVDCSKSCLTIKPSPPPKRTRPTIGIELRPPSPGR